nr:thioredoxin-like domain-containing protein [uncultured Flavobacterium sp.]
MIASFFKTYKAEGIKLKNTYIYWLALILTFVTPTIYVAFHLFKLKEYNKEIYPNFKIFEIVFNDISGSYLSFFYLLTLVLATSRLAQVDFKYNTWQMVETLPVSKFNIYFSKFLRVISVLFIGLLAVIVISILSALFLYLLVDNKENVSLSLPIIPYLQYLTKGIVASLFAVSVLFFISIRFSNFIFTMLIGFGLIIAMPILNALGKLPKWEMYKLIGNVTDAKSDIGKWFTYSDYVSICLAIPFLVVGYFWYKDRTFKNAFIQHKKQLLLSVATIVVFFGLAYYFLLPNQQLPSNKTVVQGEVISTVPLKNVYLIDPVLDDTLGVTTITDNKFSMEIKKEMPLGQYNIFIDNKVGKSVFMATNDNIILDYKKLGDKNSYKILGTRIAENVLNFNSFNFNNVSYQLENNIDLDDTEAYFKNIEAEHNDNIKNMLTTYTADNFIPRQDFLEINEKNITISTLLLYDEYQKKYNLNFNKKLPENKFITNLEKTITLNDNTLINNSEYATYIKYQYIKSDTTDLDEDTKFINAIAKLKKSDFKDRLVFNLAKQSLENTKDANKIAQIETQFQDQFLNPKVTQNFKQNITNAKRMALGQTAPNFLATNSKGETVSLDSFIGKFVVIDVWATWCGPCQYQSPQFDKVANTYKKSDDIVFIALSVDEKIDKWIIDIKDKKVNVLQLHVKNETEFSKLYNISSIPRFILIGKNGELINSSLPFPSTDEFEIELQKHLKP